MTTQEVDASESKFWNEDQQQVKSKISKNKLRLIYTFLGLFSFLFFLYFSFPYGILKEVLVVQISSAIQRSGLPVRVTIGEFSPYWITGIKLKNINITNLADSQASLLLSSVHARLNVLPLMIGRISADVRIEQGAGFIQIDSSLPITNIVSDHALPRSVTVRAKGFGLDGFVNQGLAVLKGSQNPNMALVLPLVQKTSAGGKLDAEIIFDNPTPSVPNSSKMSVDAKLPGFFLHINDSTLDIQRQDFSEAKLLLKQEGGIIQLQEANFVAPDLGIFVKGDMQSHDMDGLIFDLKLDLTMNGAIQKNLGFIVPTIMGCRAGLVDGKLSVTLKKTAMDMVCE